MNKKNFLAVVIATSIASSVNAIDFEELQKFAAKPIDTTLNLEKGQCLDARPPFKSQTPFTPNTYAIYGDTPEEITYDEFFKIENNIAPYEWRHGCVPTSIGMVLNYWAKTGYPQIFPTSGNPDDPDTYEKIASNDHYQSYSLPLDEFPNILPDMSEPPVGDEHISNSIADYLKTSWSLEKLAYGGTWENDIIPLTGQYLQTMDPTLEVLVVDIDVTENPDIAWEALKILAQSNVPALGVVDSSGDEISDHAVMIYGYATKTLENEPTTKYYVCHNTWDSLEKVYEFQTPNKSKPYGISRILALYIPTEVKKTPLYKFQYKKTNIQYYTTDETEKDNILKTQNGKWNFEGIDQTVIENKESLASPVYKILNRITGTYFYTLDTKEKEQFTSRVVEYKDEGIAFYAIKAPLLDGELKPVHRYYHPKTKTHTYSTERLKTDKYTIYDGVAWYSYPNTQIPENETSE